MKESGLSMGRPAFSDNLLLKFEKFIIFYNPASTNAKRSRKRIAELKDLFPSKKVEVVETSPDGLEANKSLVAKYAKKFDGKTIVCIASGDGTVSAVLDALLLRKDIPAKARKVPVLPLWGGNANDLAYMINGHPNKLSLKSIFTQGKVVPIYPLNIRFGHSGNIRKRVAACYVSFGASAYTTQQAELPKNKKRKMHAVPGSRLATEMFVVARSLIKAKTFTVRGEDGNQPLYEWIFVNGSRIAKIDRLPVRLNEKAFYEATIENKDLKALISLLSALKILRNRSYGEITEKKRSFTLNEETWAQIDGEVMKLPADTKVEISLSEKPFYVISKKLG